MEKDRNNLIKSISSLKKSNHLIIVEGKKDKASLEKLDLNNIFVINKTGTSLYNRIEELKNKLKRKERCIILTDIDKKGKELYDIIKKELQKDGIKIDENFRNLLINEKISHIEGLATFVMKI